MSTASTDYIARQLSQHGSFTLQMPASRAFPLFSPEGERLWVPNWTPEAVFPATEKIAFADNAVFTLERDGELLTWQILAINNPERKAEYLYMTASRTVRVKVAVQSVSEDSCRVDVTYITTSLTAEGDRHFSHGCDIEGRMKSWKDLIEAAVSDGRISLQP